MSNRFLMTVATAALIAGTSFASAQAPGGGAGSAGGGAQQSAPSAGGGAGAGGGAAGGGAMQRDSSPGAGGSGMRGESSPMKGSDTGMKASDTNDKAQPGSKSAQDGNRMQGEKSKSMHSETDSKGGKDMKRGRQVTDHGQRSHVGEGGSPAREARPDQHRLPVGEDPGNHQRELQHLGRHRRPGIGPLPSDPGPDR
jgi:hypothetical protein